MPYRHAILDVFADRRPCEKAGAGRYADLAKRVAGFSRPPPGRA